MKSSHSTNDRVKFANLKIGRLKISVRGLVQGVGFRPFVYRLATELNLAGWVVNSTQGVIIEVEGKTKRLDRFLERLNAEAPPLSSIRSLESSLCDPVGYDEFEVRQSPETGEKSALVLPDMAICPDCLKEIFDSRNRRYRYPFTNCTNCGPRYSIIESLPYDRPRTTMSQFEMCDRCRIEYEDPRNRRFHAQPNACSDCGPHLELWDGSGHTLYAGDEALTGAADVIRNGEILALKGLGGFQLLVDARNDEAVKRLRRRKAREEKPLALMYPDLKLARQHCKISEVEHQLLISPQSPIVLLRRLIGNDANSGIAYSVAPENPYFGIMLPYTPLHHLLMHELGFSVVATSGNITDEPICIDEQEAMVRLRDIADKFLVHNRPITRQVDDSVVQVVNGKPQILRSARGYAPANFTIDSFIEPSLAAGAHLKNCIAVGRGGQVFVSQHIGDLETTQACDLLSKTARSLSGLYELEPETAAVDLHPDYASTRYAETVGAPVVAVQHHYAHVLSCMADNNIEAPVLGVAWDGTGLGDNGSIWGGEFLLVNNESYTRKAHLREFPLPGGEAAVREPRRTAIGLLYELSGNDLFKMKNCASFATFDDRERSLLNQMLDKKINCPQTSSAGRLFDAVSSLLDIRHINTFSGQAAMMLGFAAEKSMTDEEYNFRIVAQGENYIVDWEPAIRDILTDRSDELPPGHIACKFHNTLAAIIVETAERIGEKKIVLTGGCFQNRYLTERVTHALEDSGFNVYWHRRVPPNDGGIALGQMMALARRRKGDR